MRILWFTNTPSLATEQLTGKVGVGGGWIESLERKMHADPDVQMAIAFPWKTPTVSKHEIGEGTYYGIPTFSPSKYKRWQDRINATIDDESEVDYYREIIHEFKPDIIHIFGSERPYGLMIPHTDVPVFLWIQGNLTVYAMKWFSDISREEVKKFTSFKSFLNGKTWIHRYRKTYKEALREQRIFSYCKNFTGRTHWDRRLSMTLSPGSNYFHVDEVMRPQFYKAQWELKEGRPKIQLFTTVRGNIYKGLNSIYLTADVLKNKVGVDVEWRLAGIAASNELVSIVEKKLRMKHQNLGIKPMGNKTPEQLIEELLHADVFVHPSHIDNSPNSVCEAMLVGTPIVATNCGGIPDLMVNGQEGFLTQPGDPYSMAGAILDIVNNPNLAREFSENSRSRGKIRNNPDKILADLMNTYKSAMKESAASV